ncbi:cation-translocating P-type ATPase [Pedobacter sp. Du54]|uniref:cation-translocating P-type ATPase n=1 Tax=Pedobacter anseongensis TaxID=3133439 RepID=UPI00309A9D1C
MASKYKNQTQKTEKSEYISGITGLTSLQVEQARKRYGPNRLIYSKNSLIFVALKSLAQEPMVVLLILVSGIYFFSGQQSEGIFLLVSVVFIAAISFYQDHKSKNALAALQRYTQPTCKVIRDGSLLSVESEQLVVGDSLVLEEGDLVQADGVLVSANDFSINESILTGESMAVYKAIHQEDHLVFMGTTIASGHAIATITAIGNQTKLGRIGKSIESIKEEETPLARQIKVFVNKMIVIGAMAFCLSWAFNYIYHQNFMQSLLGALTIAMSILPEEIPVAFASFMALGAWRLMKKGIITKKMGTVETLGSATVICIDKTGTITENKMALIEIFTINSGVSKLNSDFGSSEKNLIKMAMWASEPTPFDPMEIALHEAYAEHFKVDERPRFHLVHEYPLGGSPPMMTHVFEDKDSNRIIAAKGAPEAIIRCCNLKKSDQKLVENAITEMGSKGFRVLAVGECEFKSNDFPANQQEMDFTFVGLVAFYDPPKQHISKVLKSFYDAGIGVKLITGDNPVTTAAIAKQIGFLGYEQSLSGEQLINLTDAELQKTVKEINVFTRMFPMAKLRIINALKDNNEVVAMTGDGVNDGPALKAAHIGIAMGKKGTEIAKQAAALILVEDNLSKMVEAIAMGRRIYANLKKAIQYIISIHIPIILVVLLPLLLNWQFPNLLLPMHVVILELIMGPTCSIIFENEPIEKNAMRQAPRPFTQTFFNPKELTTSIAQGLMIAFGAFVTYQYAIAHEATEIGTRTMVFATLISANIMLTLCNRSFYYAITTTLRYSNKLMPLAIGGTMLMAALLLYLKPVANFFGFEALGLSELAMSIALGFISVIWIEALKWRKRVIKNR